MWMDDYQDDAMRTRGVFATIKEQITFSALEINAEAGEVANLIYKEHFQGHDHKRDLLILELGDVLWGLACMADALGVPLSTVAERNLEKLRARYPFGFSQEASRNRVEHPESKEQEA